MISPPTLFHWVIFLSLLERSHGEMKSKLSPSLLLTPLLLSLSLGASVTPGQSPLFIQNFNAHSVENARANALEIFNAIHSSMRQWGSSLKHNGMSFFPVSVPKGTLFYHGSHTSEPVKGMEWLAFELEHAEFFARQKAFGPNHPPNKGYGPKNPGGHPPKPPGSGPPTHARIDTHPKSEFDKKIHDDSTKKDEEGDGYLHTYQTSKPLTKLLYIDGMSAAKTSMGTLDSTDYILRNLTHGSREPNNDWIRAADLCKIGEEWGIEGFLRMEAGFEIILCIFEDGLDFVSALKTDDNSRWGSDSIDEFEYVRALSHRYQGIMGGRVEVDYSSMVSAFWYEVNFTNPDITHEELPRLVTSSRLNDLERIREDVLGQFKSGGNEIEKRQIINWQDVVDMVVTRYSDRLKFMVQNVTDEKTILLELRALLDVYIDYSNIDIPSSIEKCANHYLEPVAPRTNADFLIRASVFEVSQKICNTLFEVRGLLKGDEGNVARGEGGKRLIGELIKDLDWSTWLECGKCGYDEVCFVAIWPWGGRDDHFAPACIEKEDLGERTGYWDRGS